MSTRIGTTGTGVGVLGVAIAANPEATVATTVVDTAVLGASQVAGAATTTLAVTGSSSTSMALTGVGVVAVGGLLARLSRRGRA